MTLKDIFFSKNSKKIKNYLNAHGGVEVRYTSSRISLQFSSEYFFFVNDKEKCFDYRKKKYCLSLYGGDGGYDIFLTEKDITEELELYFDEEDEQEEEYSALCLVLQENKFRDFRLDLLIANKDLLETLKNFVE